MASIKTRLMTALQAKFPENSFRYTDILRTLKEDVKGESYDPVNDRGFYGTNLCMRSRGYLRYASKRESRHLVKNRDGSWSVAGCMRSYPLVTFIHLGRILEGRLLSSESNGNARIQLLSGGAPLFVRVGNYSTDRERIIEMTKESIEREHGHSYREYIRLMREIGENI